jgi:hypothetical protein
MSTVLKTLFVIFLFALIGVQFIEVERKNPPVAADLIAPPEVKAILKTACYDCHSNETEWPWYSSVAPVSWMITDHVREGREHLNFSNWETLYSGKKAGLKKEIWEEINNGNMPLASYTYLHPSANLDQMQKLTIKQWALGNGLAGTRLKQRAASNY